MTYDDFIAAVAGRLEWPEEKVAGIIEVILEAVSTELKMNNPVVIDDFGTLKTDIQPEYILKDPETKERFLMPPTVEFVFEDPIQKGGGDSSFRTGFTPDEALYNEVNSSFAQFEPTPLNEGVQFPGISEIVAEEPEEGVEAPELPHPQEEGTLLSEHRPQPEPEEDTEVVEPVTQEESIEFEVAAEEPEIAEPPEIIDTAELIGHGEPPGQTESAEEIASVGQVEPFEHQRTAETVKTPVRTEPSGGSGSISVGQSPPQYRSRRRVRSNKRTSSVWIPIAGGIAIVVASLFFFKGDGDR